MHERPKLRILRIAVVAFALVAPSAAWPSNVDDDMRRAAKLQRQGETAAAMAIWQRWADKGNVDAAYNLAVIHQHGDGVPVDQQKALRWYRFAAERGDRVSQYQIGLMYLNGEGVPADKEEAHRWFTAHRAHHAHHDHSAQMQAWRKQAAALIQERDQRESLEASRENAGQIVADLRRRAGMGGDPPVIQTLAGR